MTFLADAIDFALSRKSKYLVGFYFLPQLLFCFRRADPSLMRGDKWPTNQSDSYPSGSNIPANTVEEVDFNRHSCGESCQRLLTLTHSLGYPVHLLAERKVALFPAFYQWFLYGPTFHRTSRISRYFNRYGRSRVFVNFFRTLCEFPWG